MPREGACRFADHIRGDVAVEWADRAGHRHPAVRRDVTVQPGERGGRLRHEDHPRHPGRGAPVEHAAADLHAGGPRLPAAGVRPRAVRRRAGEQEQAEQAEDRRSTSRTPTSRRCTTTARRSPTGIGLTTTAETFNPVIVEFYEQVGYLPDAVLNYLLLLGWSLDDKTEDFTREEMIDAVLPGAGEQGAGQLRREEAVRVPGAVHAGAAGRARRSSGCCRSWCRRAWCRPGRPTRGDGDADRRGGRRRG